MKIPNKATNYDWFEELYAQSENDTSKIPWTDLEGNMYLQEWVNKNDMTPYKDKSVLVVGCGIGGDAELLSNYFSEIEAFDVSSSAIKWVKKRFTDSKVNYFAADLFDEKAEFQLKAPYDFIFEAYTIQALPRELKIPAMNILPTLLKKSGQLLIVCDGRENNEEGFTIPHPLSPDELITLSNQLTQKKFEQLEGNENRGLGKRVYRVLFQK
jgi:SAM-dependent methyltransferase